MRRGRVPRLLFVDHQVLDRHTLDFPEDGGLSRSRGARSQAAVHTDAINSFRQALETAYRRAPDARRRQASVIAGDGWCSATRLRT